MNDILAITLDHLFNPVMFSIALEVLGELLEAFTRKNSIEIITKHIIQLYTNPMFTSILQESLNGNI